MLVAAFLALAGFAQPARDPHAFLRNAVRFSDAELARVDAGEATVKVLPATDRREIVTFGVVRVGAARERFLEHVRDIESFKKSPLVLQVGKLSAEPRLQDFAALALDETDVEALRDCRVGDCDVRLTAAEIARVRAEVRWSAPDARTAATALFRDILFRRAVAYGTGGTEALEPYRDHGSVSLSPSAEFAALVATSTYFFDGADAFRTYLARFPKAPLPNVEDFLYWSKEQFGLKPVVSLTHTSIHHAAEGSQAAAFVASKQIYASHYFDASLGFTTLVSAEGEPAGFYLLYYNRSRSDSLRSVFRSFARAGVQRRTREEMSRLLTAIKKRLEGA